MGALTCSVDGCGRAIRNKARLLCNTHYLRFMRFGDVHHKRSTPQRELPCVVDGCELPRQSKGLCSKHIYRRDRFGDPMVCPTPREKHGQLDHPLYTVWMNMRRRCHAPNATSYEHYGGRGISVCDRWRYSFSAFLEDVGNRPDGCYLDRIDNDGNYEPSNVRWSTMSEQVKNTRPIWRNNTSGHKGVSFDKSHHRWRAYHNVDGVRVELGYYNTQEEAKDARHAATVEDPFIVCCEELDALREHARHKSMTPTT